MLEKHIQKLMSMEDKHFGIAPGFKTMSPFPFGSMNQQASRQGMEDTEFFYRENFIKIGPGNLRTLWDQGAPVYTAPSGKTVVYYSFFNVGTANFCALFLSDGTAIQLNMLTFAQTIISSTANTFYIGGQLPACGQWGSQYLLISNNFNNNAYWIWDRLTLYGAGTLGPQITITAAGSGYSSPPTVTANGGSGSGAQFTATVTAGAVTAVQVTNAGSGYKPGEVVQLQFSGGGSNNEAVLTAVLTATTLAHIALLAGGSGYVSPTVSITGGGGTGATAVCTQVGGAINSITLTAAGSGFTSMPTVAFVDASGTGAQAQVFLTETTVASITVTNGGNGYPSAPTVTFSGGGASVQATGHTTLSGTSVNTAVVDTAGTNYNSVPTVTVQTGLNNSAAATANLMPFGASGASIETFNSRVWLPYPNQSGNLINSGVFLVSAPGSVTDFAPSDGGEIFTSTDSFLKAQYVNIKQSNGYLYPIGDSSVSVISNVQTSGNPITTTFNYQNTDPQTGTSWRDTVQSFSTSILMTNVFGIHGVYGGKVSKLSEKMDNIFLNAVSPANGGVTPTSAVANLFNQKAYLVNITVKDPFTQAQRTVMVGWDEKEFFIASQASVLTFIATQEIDSNMFAWGTDGHSLYPLFNTPSTRITKKLSTKLYGQQNFLTEKGSMGVYAQVQDLSPGATGVVFDTLTVDTEHGSYEVPTIAPFPSTPPPNYAIVSMGSGDVTAVNMGLTLTSTSEDFTLNNLVLGVIEVGSIAMSSSVIDGTIDTE